MKLSKNRKEYINYIALRILDKYSTTISYNELTPYELAVLQRYINIKNIKAIKHNISERVTWYEGVVFKSRLQILKFIKTISQESLKECKKYCDENNPFNWEELKIKDNLNK